MRCGDGLGIKNLFGLQFGGFAIMIQSDAIIVAPLIFAYVLGQ